MAISILNRFDIGVILSDLQADIIRADVAISKIDTLYQHPVCDTCQSLKGCAVAEKNGYCFEHTELRRPPHRGG